MTPPETQAVVFEDSWEVRSGLIDRGVYLAERCRIEQAVLLEPPVELPGRLKALAGWAPERIGAFSYSWSRITGAVRSIGRYCSIAGGVSFGAQEHATDRISTSSFTYEADWMWGRFAAARGGGAPFTEPVALLNAPVVIEDDVWIGLNAYLKAGVRLGLGCIVGANACVTRDVPPFAIVVGNPARIVRYRFGEQLRARLLESRWWDYAFTDLPVAGGWDRVESILDALEEARRGGGLQPYRPPLIELKPPPRADAA